MVDRALAARSYSSWMWERPRAMIAEAGWSPLLLAASIVLFLRTYTTDGAVYSAHIALVGIALVLSRPRLPGRAVMWPLWAYFALVVVSIPGAILWGHGHLIESTLYAMVILPGAVYLFVEHREYIYRWLIPVWIVHAYATWFEVLIFRMSRVDGLATDPNLAAGFLVMGTAYSLATRRIWLALWLAPPIVFTQSRGAVIALGAVLIVALIMRLLPVRWSLELVAGVLLALAVLGLANGAPRFFAPSMSFVEQIEARLGSCSGPVVIPSGVNCVNHQPHNVLYRIAVQEGVLAALALVAAVVALIRRGPGPVPILVLVGFAGLSLFDYYPLMTLGPFLWLALGDR